MSAQLEFGMNMLITSHPLFEHDDLSSFSLAPSHFWNIFILTTYNIHMYRKKSYLKNFKKIKYLSIKMGSELYHNPLVEFESLTVMRWYIDKV